jgi:hypothetical protein
LINNLCYSVYTIFIRAKNKKEMMNFFPLK